MFLKHFITPLLLILLPAGSFCAFDAAKSEPDLTKLSPGIYANIVSPDSNAVANSGFIVMKQGVLVFDTHFTPEAGKELLAKIRSVTSKPVRFVINSHAHADHTHGNQVFADAQLIGSTTTRRNVLQFDIPSMNRTIGIAQAQLEELHREMTREVDAARLQQLREQIKPREQYVNTMSHLKIMAPFVTLDDRLIIREQDYKIEIIFLGTGHTDGDTILYLPSAKIAFLGDLFFNRAIPNVQDGNILEWMKTLKKACELEADKFVPGHGPVGSKRDLEDFLAYFEELKSLVESAVEEGHSTEWATREIKVPSKYTSYLFQNLFPSNVQKMYTEVKELFLESIITEGPQKPQDP
jgi:cyclase